MGHKVHPVGFRLGVIRDWQSKWYSEKHYAEYVVEDYKLRERILTHYREAAISTVEIDRQAKDISLTIYTARPGIVIGRGGQRVDEMRSQLEELIGKRVRLNIMEVRQPELDAFLVARSIAEQMERRVAYRRAMKQSMFRTIQAGAKGIKISIAGRLGGAEIARRQTMHQGQVPLHTLRADIDYGMTEARTTMGRIGVKVWIYKGEIKPERRLPEIETPEAEATPEEAVATLKEEAVTEAVNAVPEAIPEPEAIIETPAAAETVAEAPEAVATEELPAAEEVAAPEVEVVAEAPTPPADEAKPEAEPKPVKKPAAAKPKKPAVKKTKAAGATAEGKPEATEAATEEKPKRRTAVKKAVKPKATTETPEAEAPITETEEKEAGDGTATEAG